ncbi:sulfurtransferase-like selenium metabolism protein YedF [candidate division WOR-3 bacterium]|nr:sulfurtransferase-like selenium metabolism protein YedF [candidate division WOR-3 bacterium]
MIKKLDAKGLACPRPVVLTKNALDEIEEGIVEVTVDNEPASENVARLARNSGCNVDIRKEDENFVVKIEKKKENLKEEREEKKTISVFVSTNTMGKGDDKLGKILIRAFFPTLLETESQPNKLIFMNSGVKLTVEGSEVIDPLKKIENEGIEILVCGTCLDFFNIKDKIKVGRISNMFEIVNSLINSDKTVTL